MRSFKAIGRALTAALALTLFLCIPVGARDLPDPRSYTPPRSKVEQEKRFYDDPRPFLKKLGPAQVVPPEIWNLVIADPEEMKRLWAELVGFKAPDLVGKIAPEIKPGKYTYKEVQANPGFKKLMWPAIYETIKPGGPPFAGNMPEIEVIPTQQYYVNLKVAQATKENLGKAKLDQNGYMITDSWVAGIPFPQPSGPHAGRMLLHNWEVRYSDWGQDMVQYGFAYGYTKDLREDNVIGLNVGIARLAGRVIFPPYGWMDKRAKERWERDAALISYTEPRDLYGTTLQAIYFLGPDIMDQQLMFIPSLRRVRKLSATDTQDPIGGADAIYDDGLGFRQKLSPNRYPYDCKILEEREYLMPVRVDDGSGYVTKEGKELHNVLFERRPIYVLEMIQKDPNYVYGKRIMLIDKETFMIYHVANYDQKGRLYRTSDINYSWWPEAGIFSWMGAYFIGKDHIDLHSTIQLTYQLPAPWTRGDISLKGMLRRAK